MIKTPSKMTKKVQFSEKEGNPRYRFTFPMTEMNIYGDILLFDKPYRCTSFEIVKQLRYAIKRQFGKKIKVGHAGTLDPLATGLLVICIGNKTKIISEIQAADKEYIGTFTLGATTPSFDLEKEVDAFFSYDHITNDKILEVAQSFLGETEQIPPLFSAVKVDGQRAYNLARSGEKVEIQAKKITISTFDITNINLPNVDFRIVCSKGTYIRALARDFGTQLESGAFLSSLRRTKIGDYSVEDALNMEVTIEQITPVSK